MGLADDYADAIHGQQKLYATWWPNARVQPGDYGTLSGRRFRRLGHINDAPLLVDVKVKVDAPTARYRMELAHEEASVTKFGAGVEVAVGVVSAKPGLKVSFESRFGFYMLLGGATVRRIDNLAAIKPRIEALAESDDDDPRKWDDRRWVLVTEVIEATNGLVLLSKKRGTEIVLEATADVPNIDLAGGQIGFTVRRDSTSTQQFFPERAPLHLTPLMALAHVDRGLFGRGAATLADKLGGGGPPEPTKARLIEMGGIDTD
ncbi:MAG: hypothetical protein KC766_33895, partial [Myxococcales bacterium]|nr:hypothetical protein [Myxococcales bacterium]